MAALPVVGGADKAAVGKLQRGPVRAELAGELLRRREVWLQDSPGILVARS